ncbi:hypothetical protein [Methylobacterium sp. Leaf399]|uniref:hypothetical protein n=1 Tax=Methylobacterium sp. Leaf399 TaxID=1736364 RepID=UPI0012E3F571|nr:hypothetical protein [Methylobacterium sp. Leaf399]
MATKSTGIGRGGRRQGAGRKPKYAGSATATELQIGEAAQAVVAAMQQPGGITRAADLVAKAYATLEDVMDNSPFPAPRVTAARAVLDLAREESDKSNLNGKKAVRQAAADQATAGGGKFAQRSGPRLVASNP